MKTKKILLFLVLIAALFVQKNELLASYRTKLPPTEEFHLNFNEISLRFRALNDQHWRILDNYCSCLKKIQNEKNNEEYLKKYGEIQQDLEEKTPKIDLYEKLKEYNENKNKKEPVLLNSTDLLKNPNVDPLTKSQFAITAILRALGRDLSDAKTGYKYNRRDHNVEIAILNTADNWAFDRPPFNLEKNKVSIDKPWGPKTSLIAGYYDNEKDMRFIENDHEFDELVLSDDESETEMESQNQPTRKGLFGSPFSVFNVTSKDDKTKKDDQ